MHWLWIGRDEGNSRVEALHNWSVINSCPVVYMSNCNTNAFWPNCYSFAFLIRIYFELFLHLDFYLNDLTMISFDLFFYSEITYIYGNWIELFNRMINWEFYDWVAAINTVNSNNKIMIDSTIDHYSYLSHYIVYYLIITILMLELMKNHYTNSDLSNRVSSK